MASFGVGIDPIIKSMIIRWKETTFLHSYSASQVFCFSFFAIGTNIYLAAAGFGILGYGIFYFVFHDVIVHQRIKWRPKNRSHYLNRMIKAHYIHHLKRTKEDCEAFGFLYVPKKFENREVIKEKNTAQ